MKVIHLISGAGPMYCGSCMHGNTLASGLRKAGVDIVVAPLYTPVRTDEENISIDRLAMGGINVFLDESMPLWRYMPQFLRRQLDRPAVVAWAATRGGQTRPEQLGRLTLAMFRGTEGSLEREIGRLVAWLETEGRPDAIHLSNVMLAGLARPLRERLRVPIVATLSGEDTFLEKLPQPFRDQAKAELRIRAADLSGLIAMNEFYADFMAQYLEVPRSKITVIRPGLNLDGHAQRVAGSRLTVRSPNVKTIGFFGRICDDKGLHLLVDAVHELSANGTPVRLRAAGYLDRQDHSYLEQIQQRAADIAMNESFEYVGELDRQGKTAFLQSLDILCLPSKIRESKGLPALEGWANGIPAVLPDHGAFSDLVRATGGGLLYDPTDGSALAKALAKMIHDEKLAADCGRRGQAAIHDQFTAEREARETIAFYQSLASC